MSSIRGWVAAGVLCALLAAPGAARAVEGSVETAVMSKYVWRGQIINDEAVLQPSVTVSTGNGLSFNTWGNLDLTDYTKSTSTDAATGAEVVTGDASGEFTEIDWSLAYALPLEGPISVELGVVEYTFPFAGGSTREASVSAKAGEVPLSPTVSLAYDFDEVDGYYASIGASHSLELAEGLKLDLGASVGYANSDYNAYYFGVNDSALNDLTVTAGLGYQVTKSLSLGAGAQYAMFLDNKIKDGAAATYGDDSSLVFGVTASYGF